MIKTLNISIIGLGKLGTSLYDVIRDNSNHKLSYYDIIKKYDSYEFQDLDDATTGKDLIFICVSTPQPEEYDGSKVIDQKELIGFDYNYDSVDNILDNIKDTEVTVVITSTISPDKIRSIFEEYNYLNIIYNPFMFEGGNEYQSIKDQKNVIIGSFSESYKKLIDLYEEVGTIGHVNKVSPLEASLIKMLHNSYTSLRISFVNSVQRLTDITGGDAQNILDNLKTFPLFNSPKFLNVGLPSGGPCIPRDSMVISGHDVNNGIFSNIVNERFDHVEWLTNKIIKHLKKTNKKGVSLFGLSYKVGVDNLTGSSAVLLYNSLVKRGITCLIDEEDDDSLIVLLNTNHKPKSTHYDVWKDRLIDYND